MTYEEALSKLEDATAALKLASERLTNARRGVFSGAYHPEALGEALTAYRQIERKCQVLCAEVERLETERLKGMRAEPPKPQSFEPTPHMRFIKWLVQTGRLSDEL
ncbi:MAG: hypothetical protein HYW33_02860 [Candidatus Blackburnbacteria bacterium]|nr:hypothetical protein [Candidatus Blackburnbacteria bacterium]